MGVIKATLTLVAQEGELRALAFMSRYSVNFIFNRHRKGTCYLQQLIISKDRFIVF